jgi:hypothetical protein
MNRPSAAFKLRRQHGPDGIAKALAAGNKKAERITKMQKGRPSNHKGGSSSRVEEKREELEPMASVGSMTPPILCRQSSFVPKHFYRTETPTPDQPCCLTVVIGAINDEPGRTGLPHFSEGDLLLALH